MSASVASSLARPRSPITAKRNAACGTWAAMSIVYERAARKSRYSGNVDHSPHGTPSCSAVPGMSSTPSIKSTSTSWPPGGHGAKPTPQLPITRVVTPLLNEGSSSSSHVACPSKCVCTSIQPGATMAPEASNSRSPARLGPMAVITPSSIARSQTNDGAPVPSTIVPDLSTSSCFICAL